MGTLSDIRQLKWGDWLYTLIAAAISAAATTIMANPIASALGAVAFSPRQLMILAGSSALVAVAGVLRKSPLPDRAVAVALLTGVHTQEDVDKVLTATASGTVPTQAVAAAILSKPPDPPK